MMKSFLLLLFAPMIASAADTRVLPSSIDLTLDEGETAIKTVAYTFTPNCIRPVLVDVIASNPDAVIENLSGTDLNGCGGDTSKFTVEFEGTGIPIKFELQFIDAEFGGILATIPVKVKVVPTSVASPSSIDLILAKGETSIQLVSWTFFPICVTPFEVDVDADNKGALVNNLSGSQKNGCGGQESQFKIEFEGTGFPQKFSLQFVNVNGGGVLESIPVNIVPPESLMGVWIGQDSINFQVFSNGCTDKDDFKVDVLQSKPLQVRLVRLTPDHCKAIVPLGTRIRFSYKELGISNGGQFIVTNPLGVVNRP